MKSIPKRGDLVKAFSGPFKGRSGYVCRVDGYSACVVWKGVWNYGIWTPAEDMKVTRKFKGE